MFDFWVWKIPWRRAWQPTPVFLPGESHEQRSQAGYSPCGSKESDTAEYRRESSYRTNLLADPVIYSQRNTAALRTKDPYPCRKGREISTPTSMFSYQGLPLTRPLRSPLEVSLTEPCSGKAPTVSRPKSEFRFCGEWSFYHRRTLSRKIIQAHYHKMNHPANIYFKILRIIRWHRFIKVIKCHKHHKMLIF